MAILDQLPGDHRLMRLQNRTVLDHVLALRGRWTESLANTQARLAERMDLLGADDPGLAVDYNNLAVALNRMDRFAEALAAYDRCLQLLQAGGLGNSARAAGVERGRALLLARTGALDSAEAAMQRAEQLRRQNLPENHPDHRDTAFGRAILSRYQGDLGAAAAALQALLDTASDDEPRLGEFRLELGSTQLRAQQWQKAAATLRLAAQSLRPGSADPHPLAIYAGALAAFADWKLGADAAATELQLAQAYVSLERAGLKSLDEAADLLQMRSVIALAQGRDRDAADHAASATERYRALGLAAPGWIR